MDVLGTCRELEDRIAALETRLARQGAILGASSNYWTMQGVTGIHTQTGTAAGAVCLAAIALIPQYTGLFQVDASLTFSCDTTAKACQVQLVSDTFLAAQLAAGAGGATVATAGWGGAGIVPGFGGTIGANQTVGLILTSDAAGTAANGIIFHAAPFTTAPQVQQTAKKTTLTGLLTASVGAGDGAGNMTFDAHGKMGNSINTAAKTPFVVSPGGGAATYNTVAFGILLSDPVTGAEVWTLESLDFTVTELMAA